MLIMTNPTILTNVEGKKNKTRDTIIAPAKLKSENVVADTIPIIPIITGTVDSNNVNAKIY